MTTIETNIDIEFEIDADEIVGDAEYKIQEICENYINEYDFTDVINTGIENAENEGVLDDQLESWLKENPAVIVRVLLATLTWMEGRQRLVTDQSNEMDLLRDDNLKQGTMMRELKEEVVRLAQPKA